MVCHKSNVNGITRAQAVVLLYSDQPTHVAGTTSFFYERERSGAVFVFFCGFCGKLHAHICQSDSTIGAYQQQTPLPIACSLSIECVR
jgi:hypothetical protein